MLHNPVSLSMGIVDLIVVCGNIFVLYVLVSQSSLHTSTNFLVLSLTISDLLLGTVILPFAIIQEERKEWLFGDVGCRLWLSVDVWLSTASIYNLLAISFDRYMAVKQPIIYPSVSSRRMTRLMITLVWLFSMVLASCLFVLETLDGSEKRECTPMQLPSLYIIFSASASFIVPAVIMVALNVSIFCTVLTTSRSKCVSVSNGASMRIHRGTRKHPAEELKRYSMESDRSSKKKSTEESFTPIRRQTVDTVAVTPRKVSRLAPDSPAIRSFLSHIMLFSILTSSRRTATVMTSAPRERRPTRFSRLSLRTEIRVARTTGIVVAAFVLCWLPFTMIYVLQAYDMCSVPTCIPEVLFTIAFWLGYANSAINPLLYAAFSRDFRAAFRRVLWRQRKPI